MRSGTKELITRLPPGLQQTSGDPAHSSSSELKTTPCLTSLVSRVGRFCPLGLCVAALKYAVMRHCEGALLTFACRAQRYFGVGLPAGWRLAASRRSGNGRHVIDRLAQIGRSCVPISKTAEFRLRSSPSARNGKLIYFEAFRLPRQGGRGADNHRYRVSHRVAVNRDVPWMARH